MTNYYKKYTSHKHEYLGLMRDFSGGGNDDMTYQEVIHMIAKFVKPNTQHKFKNNYGMKQLSNQVIELNKATYLSELQHKITNHLITDKIDGKRTILYLSNDRSYAVNDVLTRLDISLKETTILDTELYEGDYYIFDVMVYNGRSLIDRPFEERLKYFDKFSDMTGIKTKPFIRLTDNYKEQIRDFKKEKKPYEVDGIILTPADGTYTQMLVYKYKPPDHLTVDLMIKRCPVKLQEENKLSDTDNNRTLYLLFCGINKRVFYKLSMRMVGYYNEIFPDIDTKNLPQYFPIQFEPSSRKTAYFFWSDRKDLDGEVGEFLYNTQTKEWMLKKIREDRRVEVKRGNYFGNNYKIAEFVWMAYMDPLIIEDIQETQDIYFQEHNNILHKASRNFNSYVKSEIFKKFRNTNWVMDLASGKGQDLFRYGSNNMRNVIFIELDRTALMELIARKHLFATDEKIRNHMNILIQNVDLLDKYRRNIRLIDLVHTQQNIDLIMCNLAFHYLMKNKKSLQNICKLINYYLKPGGRFVFSAFDGHKVVRLLEEHQGEWTVRVRDQIKYSILKKYSGNQITRIGQKIDVRLPFSRNTYYSEYLINIDTIEKALGKYLIVMESNESFSKYFNHYNKQAELDANDRKYIDLYHYYIFVKK